MGIRPFVTTLALLAVACSGSATHPAAEGTGGRDGPAARAVEKAAGAELRRASMQAGTEWIPGELAEFCAGDRCTVDDRAQPRRFLATPEDGLLLFLVAVRPTEGSIEVQRPGGKTVLRRSLAPSTSMAVRARLEDGKYLVSLRARWEGRSARWVFGVRGFG